MTSCSAAVDEADCTAQGGVFLAGADCVDDPCDTGACCDNLDCGQADAFSCITVGRTFAGAGTSCLDDPCGAGVGACCFGDGSCQDLSPQDCATAGGEWLGAGTNCGQGPCTLGACCVRHRLISNFQNANNSLVKPSGSAAGSIGSFGCRVKF